MQSCDREMQTIIFEDELCYLDRIDINKDWTTQYLFYGLDNNLDPQKEKYKDDEAKYLYMFENPIQIEEGIYTCKKCNCSKTYSYQLQTRSADEGMTTFIECSQCKNKWRIS